jgi:hypothetical protein
MRYGRAGFAVMHRSYQQKIYFVHRSHLRSSRCWNGLGADSVEKQELASDLDTAVVDSLKALDPHRPIREADI